MAAKTTGCCDVKFKNPTLVKKLSEGNLEFALNLYQTMTRNQDSNLFCSPFSVTAALSMTFAGARGNTATELMDTMKLDTDVHLALADVMKSLNMSQKSIDGIVLRCANRMYVDGSCRILDEFTRILVEQYGTEPRQVDFKRSTEATRLDINKWVEQVTEDKIKDLIVPGLLNDLTRMVLVNAIYFKGNWTTSFDPNRTIDGDFHLDVNGNKFTVKMMNIAKKKFRYVEDKDLRCKLLELPYAGDDRVSMFLILPDQVDGLVDLETRICGGGDSSRPTFEALMQSLRSPVKVDVSIPKFKMEYTVSLSDDVLRRMGIRDLFSQSKADLSGITGDNDLHVSAVIHKAFVDVNEEGTEAAAATAVVFLARRLDIEPPRRFIADHPFMFVIYDKMAELVLFVGRLKDPTKAAQ